MQTVILSKTDSQKYLGEVISSMFVHLWIQTSHEFKLNEVNKCWHQLLFFLFSSCVASCVVSCVTPCVVSCVASYSAPCFLSFLVMSSLRLSFGIYFCSISRNLAFSSPLRFSLSDTFYALHSLSSKIQERDGDKITVKYISQDKHLMWKEMTWMSVKEEDMKEEDMEEENMEKKRRGRDMTFQRKQHQNKKKKTRDEKTESVSNPILSTTTKAAWQHERDVIRSCGKRIRETS